MTTKALRYDKGVRMTEHRALTDLRTDAGKALLPDIQTNRGTAQFDGHFEGQGNDGQTLSGLKRLQDPAKFGKARFSFRLYKR